MLRIHYILPVLLTIIGGLLCAGDDEKSRKRAERRLVKIEARAKSMARPADTDELSRFFLRETQRLIERSRIPISSYEFDRLLEAVDDLLDAREDIHDAEKGANTEDKEETRADTAKRLERAYFRVQQGDYFARLSADNQAPDYVLRSRQLYQKARAAYDGKDFRRANKLASASSELVNVLENLAQATVRKREPPVLK